MSTNTNHIDAKNHDLRSAVFCGSTLFAEGVNYNEEGDCSKGCVSRTAGDDLLQLVEERLEAILLEGEECLAGCLLGGEDAIDVGNLQYRWAGGQVVIVQVRLASEEEGAEVVAARYGGRAGGALGGSSRAAGNARQKEGRVEGAGSFRKL